MRPLFGQPDQYSLIVLLDFSTPFTMLETNVSNVINSLSLKRTTTMNQLIFHIFIQYVIICSCLLTKFRKSSYVPSFNHVQHGLVMFYTILFGIRFVHTC